MNYRTTTSTEEKVMNYLNELRTSGETNMFGALPYIMKQFPHLSNEGASRIFSLWRINFNENSNYKFVQLN